MNKIFLPLHFIERKKAEFFVRFLCPRGYDALVVQLESYKIKDGK